MDRKTDTRTHRQNNIVIHACTYWCFLLRKQETKTYFGYQRTFPGFVLLHVLPQGGLLLLQLRHIVCEILYKVCMHACMFLRVCVCVGVCVYVCAYIRTYMLPGSQNVQVVHIFGHESNQQ
jgi:hypothetical protein